MFAMIAVAVLAGTAVAQDFSQPSAIGSYQSILSRAGYGNAMGGMAQQMMQPMQGAAVQGGAMYGMQNVQNAVSGAISGATATPGALPVPMVSAPPAAPVVGSAMVGAPMAGGQVMTAPMPMATSAPMVSSPVMGGTVVNGANCSTCDGASSLYGGLLGGTSGYSTPVYAGAGDAACGVPAYSAPVVSAPMYSAPVYQSVVAPVAVGGRRRARSNYSVGLFGMFFQRDYEDQVLLASNAAGEKLYTTDADEQTFDGYGVNFASRNCNGGGFEVVYWALNPGSVQSSVANAYTEITALDQLYHNSTGRDLYATYSTTLSQTVTRETDINNLELNLLRNGGRFCRRNRQGFYEMFGGFRWFEFNESLQYAATLDTAAYPGPSDFVYSLRARNRLIGLQLGARNEVCLGPKLRLFNGVQGGLFNNNIRTSQDITDSNGEVAVVNSGPAAGRAFNYTDEKNDVAFLGQLDFGILYHLSCRARLRLGYRVLGVSGVALAAHQLPFRYNDPEALSRANSNGSLLLNGGYYGMEFCF